MNYNLLQSVCSFLYWCYNVSFGFMHVFWCDSVFMHPVVFYLGVSDEVVPDVWHGRKRFFFSFVSILFSLVAFIINMGLSPSFTVCLRCYTFWTLLSRFYRCWLLPSEVVDSTFIMLVTLIFVHRNLVCYYINYYSNGDDTYANIYSVYVRIERTIP